MLWLNNLEELDLINMAVSMSRGARESCVLATIEVCICCRVEDLVGRSIFSMSVASEGPDAPACANASMDTVEVGVDVEDATEAALEEGWLFVGLLVGLFAVSRRGIDVPSTFQAFFSSSLSSGMPQYLSARCLRVSKGTSATYSGNSCCIRNSPTVGVSNASTPPGSGLAGGLEARALALDRLSCDEATPSPEVRAS